MKMKCICFRTHLHENDKKKRKKKTKTQKNANENAKERKKNEDAKNAKKRRRIFSRTVGDKEGYGINHPPFRFPNPPPPGFRFSKSTLLKRLVNAFCWPLAQVVLIVT